MRAVPRIIKGTSLRAGCEEAARAVSFIPPIPALDSAAVASAAATQAAASDMPATSATVGYRRFGGLEAAAALARLYATVRLFVNFFQPSFKLAEKARDGARVKKRYHPAATPFQRLLADTRVAVETKEQARAIHATLDPVALLREMRMVQQHLVEIADKTLADQSKPTTPTLEQFLSGCARRGRRVKSNQQHARTQTPSGCAVGPIHSRQSMVSCANGSRPSHGGRRGSYSSVCSRNAVMGPPK